MTLCTDRLRLRPITASDAQALHGVWTNPDVRRYLFDGAIIPMERANEIIEASERCFASLGAGLYAIRLASDPGTVAGFCGFRRFEDTDQPELLYGMLPAYWGQGYVTEAARAMLRYGFENCAMVRVLGVTDTPNQRSVRVMQRIGMFFLERREYHGLDTVFFCVNREEFQASA